MAMDRFEIRCTDKERAAWEQAAARSPFRKLGSWLKWLANEAADAGIEVKVTLAGQGSPDAALLASAVPSVPKRLVVKVERDWDTGLPIVAVGDERVDWQGEQSVPALRLRFESWVITEIRKQLRELN